jgi:hypothetical protein
MACPGVGEDRRRVRAGERQRREDSDDQDDKQSVHGFSTRQLNTRRSALPPDDSVEAAWTHEFLAMNPKGFGGIANLKWRLYYI